jgi:hypothetical protein
VAERSLPDGRIATASHHDCIPRLVDQVHHPLDDGVEGG